MTDINAINGIVSAQHNQPHQVLGLQTNDTGYITISAFLPYAQSVSVFAKNTKKVIATLNKLDDNGFYSKKLRRKKLFDYQLEVTVNGKKSRIEDPFAFAPTLGELDLHLLREGNHLHPYNILGAHVKTINGVKGVSFAVWAPNAKRVSVVGEFNNWDGRCHPLTNQDFSGYWSLFIPQLSAGELYKFEILDNDGNLLPLKADPYGLQAQFRPETASIVNAEKHYKWQDKAWLKARENRNSRHAAISIYEVHLGSWQRDQNDDYLNYRELADKLIPYTLEMGFTHIQLMPVSEFPYDGSWGYQPVGLFAPSSRFGDADDFKYFVDQCHQANLGVLIDWVPGHFPIDQHGLAQFDGTHLYEHADPRQGFHPDWNTLIYNYGRTEVANFLRASALHWLDRFHVDGIRVDAVASMLYLDYSRKEGEWIPNEHGGRENLEAVAFLQRFNEELYREYPGTFSVAEESTSWPGVSKPTDAGGLGFGYKWNMGWMNDTLEYIKREPVHRKHHHNEISFGLVYAFDENFILPISHDEVVHGKGSMIERMPGDAWQQFANLRAYYGFMWSHPGKKLLFMGSEFAQGPEWNFEKSLEWHQLDIHWHSQIQQLVKDLNRVYQATPALYQHDCEHQGFSWLDHENAEQSVYSYMRFGQDGEAPVVVICNFSDQVYQNFTVGVPEQGHYQELLNTDSALYGGSNQGNFGGVGSTNTPMHNQAQSIEVTVPPLATLIFKLEK
ncbi:1,4-alpha-glucan branching enzyme GlgB [Thalassotalea loyana]|uniref:1,4-alpha-glucan branching enzyme GlgB n=1 Tax=Thalassotalea loyana TaxID=280483 RepID=A0ABQ6HCU3_9GAMM|nr:1,4-alpha-glucan branching protein GlgB [Thalassotalea loyana]GLX84291.1 1,4-alpha-glucan branching enzyme GlgB [Thalassotalea loyana]